MSKIALTWDEKLIRIVTATPGRGAGQVQFDQAMTLDLSDQAEGLSPEELGQKIRELLEKNGVLKGDVSVVVARGDIEMRQFELPPVPPEELPDMVRFMARNHFTSFGEDCLLDFVPIKSQGEKTTVLAAALDEVQTKKIQQTIEATGLKLTQIVLRPFAAAELANGSAPSSDCRIVVEVVGREADISVVNDGCILLTRTARVPDDYTDEQFAGWMPGEINRTIASAKGQAGSPDIHQIVVLGDQDQQADLHRELNRAFEIETQFLNPPKYIQATRKFSLPNDQNGFASLLGSFQSTGSESNNGLDFLNPRKKPDTKRDLKKLYWGAAAAACVALLIGAVVWFSLSAKQAEVDRLQARYRALTNLTQSSENLLKEVKSLDEWRCRDIDWLEELHRLSEHLPGPDHSRITSIVGESSRGVVELGLDGLLNTKEKSLQELTDDLSKLNYSEVTQDRRQSTAIEGFDRDFGVTLFFPYSKVTPDGELMDFTEQAEVANQKTDRQ